MNKISLLVENCWVIRTLINTKPYYHVVGQRWTISPIQATIYRREIDAQQFINANRGLVNSGAIFAEGFITESVPLEGAILVAGIQSAAQKG